MQFDRLRLTGFKSFVDPTELAILPGLTGVVGPNGCGKSNLLEALRWVMGESRPTAMRGAGMEDVIFAGSGRRPARAQAEVTISVDNTDRVAPAGLNDADRLDITRRITRDAGSTYRLNGREVRARDVQMLFADASSGSHSPALVRQGQIGALINARPQARRRILEEAAGISGLYQRRHEALLKLDGAAANLRRVDEILEGLAAQAAALARQARAAARYREIGAALRTAEGQLLWRRWADAEAARAEAAAALSQAAALAASTGADARRATVRREAAEGALPGLREAAHVAQAIQSRAMAERESLDEAEARAHAAIATLTGHLAQLDSDLAREAVLNRDAGDVLAQRQAEAAALGAADVGHQDRLAAAALASAAAGRALAEADASFSAAQDEAAQLGARHQSAERLIADLTSMRDRAAREADQATAALRQAEATGSAAEAAVMAAAADGVGARQQAQDAEAALSAAEAARAGGQTAESAARAVRAAADGEAGALGAEHTALQRLAARADTAPDALLAQLTAAPGWEKAAGAAMGEDLRLGPADERRPGWRLLPGYDADAPLPPGATPLDAHVSVPDALRRRLSQVGVVTDAATGASLQPALRPGQRLVTQSGDLWRWDGLTMPAAGDASAATLHLQTMNRLAETRALLEAASRRASKAATAHQTAHGAMAQATKDEAAARETRRAAERRLAEAGRAEVRAESDRSLALGRAEAARAGLTRHQADAADAAARLDEALRSRAALPDHSTFMGAVARAKASVEAARGAASARRGAEAELKREGTARAKRQNEIATEMRGWQARLAQAGARADELGRRRAAIARDLAEAQAQPATLAQRRAALIAAETAGSARLDTAQAALAAAEAALREATIAEREAERAAADARAALAGREARADAAGEAEALARRRIRDEADATPDALAARLPPGDAPPIATLEATIARLRTTREGLGAVNLRADEDKRALEAERAELDAEKADLEAAIRKLRGAIGTLNREGRQRLLAAFETVNANFRTLFTHLFGGGEARLVLVESEDPLEAGLEIMCQPPGKKLATLSLLSGGEQTLTALALIFAVFLANPAPICVLDEVDAPLDDANVTRFCDLLDEMTRRTATRFLVITHHAVTMARMDRLFGVTMVEQGVSQLVSVDLRRAEALVA